MVDSELEKALERLNNLGHLAGGVGHHVINAFSAVVSNAELLRLKTPMPGGAVDPAALADTIITTALDAATVARRLIDYTRPVTSTEPDKATTTPGTIVLDQLLASAIDEERQSAPANITFESDLVPLPPIRGHAFQLRTMLNHLLLNSYEAMPPSGGTIRVTSSTDARGWIVVELRDSGKGMDPETQVRAVEPFFTTKPGHFGVGLSIANGIWRRHRGTLSVRSQPGDGTLLRLCVEPIRE